MKCEVVLTWVDFVKDKLMKERFYLVLEGSLTRVLGLGIRHLKFYKGRILVGFPLKRRGFGPGLQPTFYVLLSR